MSGSDVYAVGYEDVNGGNTIAKLWKNGVEQSLTDGTNPASASSVYVYNNDVYVVGHEINFGIRLWKNGVVQNFENGMLWGNNPCVFVK